jgi:hypothetical protein
MDNIRTLDLRRTVSTIFCWLSVVMACFGAFYYNSRVHETGLSYVKASFSFFILYVIASTVSQFSKFILKIIMGLMLMVATMEVVSERTTCGTSCQLTSVLDWLPGVALIVSLFLWLAQVLEDWILSKRLAPKLIAIAWSAAILSHITLQFFLPRLCPKCLLIVCTSVCGLYMTLAHDSPNLNQKLHKVSLILLPAVGLLMALAVPKAEISLRTAYLDGISVETLRKISGDSEIKENELLLLTLPGCSYCEEARIFLQANRYTFRELPLNSVPQSSRSKWVSVAPQMIVMKQGLVHRHLVGYLADEYKEALK